MNSRSDDMNFTAKKLGTEEDFPLLEDRPTAQVVFEVAFASLILVSAALGNFLMMLVMYRKKQLRTVPNLFVLNLSVGNFLLAVTVLPVFVWTLVKGHWTLGETFCEIHGYQNYLLFAITLFTLTAISLNRYVLICYPTKYQGLFDKKLVLKIISAIWICCVVSCSPPLLGWGHYSFNPRTALCHTDNTSASFKITANSCMLIDILIVVFCNVRIVQKVNAHRRRIAVNHIFVKTSKPNEEIEAMEKEVCANKNNRPEALNTLAFPKQRGWKFCLSGNESGIISAKFIYLSQKRQDSSTLEEKIQDGNTANRFDEGRERRYATFCVDTNATEPLPNKSQTRELRGEDIHITRTISLIVFVFCACWLPCFLMDTMDAFGVFPPRNTRMAGIYLIFMDSVAGPFIYGIRSRKLRTAFVEVLKCG